MFAVLLHYLSLGFACCFFLNSLFPRTYLCINREVKHHVYGKREFVPRDQVSSLLVLYCSLFLHIN